MQEKLGSDAHISELKANVLEKYASFRITDSLCGRIAEDITSMIQIDFPDEPPPLVKVARAQNDPGHVDITVRKMIRPQRSVQTM